MDMDQRIGQQLKNTIEDLRRRLHNETYLKKEAADMVEQLFTRLQETNAELEQLRGDLQLIAEATLRQEIILPEGWQIVPKELTLAMCLNLEEGYEVGSQEAWKRTLESAPKWEGGVKESRQLHFICPKCNFPTPVEGNQYGSTCPKCGNHEVLNEESRHED